MKHLPEIMLANADNSCVAACRAGKDNKLPSSITCLGVIAERMPLSANIEKLVVCAQKALITQVHH